ncbi:L,D-transpeptidase Cds6 family protein [Sulfurisoma sediminicola]|uniref:Tetratricopeptide repeat protein n=1 Tax=Sulfurisoma sediminicola TaxID=1381557 RepID=A0A497X9T8_9PROT|nr:tetratricopeptide repeat protein [Sulfurisoma sediminicola]RLJ62765.1 tetratricopeptide repeat protein [Sulfurisoma sediminicola]
MLKFRDFPCRKTLLAIAFAGCAGLSLVSLPARADNLQDSQRFLKQGQHAQALEQVDKYLAGKPKDAQGRFLKGLILTEMGKTNDAIVIFTKLTEDYPELPEPYNNLAVIYAQQKQYDKAKQALEMAIRTHPSYATAHENLGDIYARLASQAYDKALQLDKGNASAQSKLAMIRDIMSTSGTTGRPGARPVVTKPAAAVAPVAEAKQAETRPIAAPEVKPAATVPVAAVAPVATPVAPATPVAEAKPAPEAKIAVEARPAATGGDANAEITKAVSAWAAAWSKKDVKGYLSHYAKDFKTPGGESRSAWEAERQKRIAKPGAIQVSFDNLRITLDGADRATARFRQHYKSASLKTSSNKVLEMVKRDGKWLIQQEKIGT